HTQNYISSLHDSIPSYTIFPEMSEVPDRRGSSQPPEKRIGQHHPVDLRHKMQYPAHCAVVQIVESVAFQPETLRLRAQTSDAGGDRKSTRLKSSHEWIS